MKRRVVSPPFWLPLLAGLPAGASLALMVLPELGDRHAMVYRIFYALLYLGWTLPLAMFQRAVWRRGWPWWTVAATVFAGTYAMAVANSVLGVGLALALGWGLSPDFRWTHVFGGLESCWLALIAFSTTHALVAHYFELRDEQARHAVARASMRDAELRALRYQLQPHFLFNALNAVSALVAEERGAEARTMIARLADFLRTMLEVHRSHESTLAEELACAEDYLDIERVRLGSRLRVKWRIGADVLRAKVPTLLLQPLIENAIRHGIAPRLTPGRLNVDVDRDGGRLLFRIENDTPAADNAAGAGPDGLRAGTRIGLRNLAERLSALYPGEHTLQAGPAPGGAFLVELALPFRIGEAPESGKERANDADGDSR